MTQEISCDQYAPVIATLSDGRRLMLRSIEADDEDALQATFYNLSEEARYMRFMTQMKHLPKHMLQRAVRPVPNREMALVAVALEDGDNAIVGGARYFADLSNECCEFAVAVADDWRRCGLASRLLRELIQSARSRRLSCMDGFVLADNKPMLELARRFGFEVLASSEGPTVRRVRLEL